MANTKSEWDVRSNRLYYQYFLYNLLRLLRIALWKILQIFHRITIGIILVLSNAPRNWQNNFLKNYVKVSEDWMNKALGLWIKYFGKILEIVSSHTYTHVYNDFPVITEHVCILQWLTNPCCRCYFRHIYVAEWTPTELTCDLYCKYAEWTIVSFWKKALPKVWTSRICPNPRLRLLVNSCQ